MPKRLSDFDVLTFDCYGTLIDWETGLWDALQPLLLANPQCTYGREDLLAAFAECEPEEQTRNPQARYPEILAATHRRIATRLNLGTHHDLDTQFARSVPHWPAFADSATSLRRLKQRYRLVILSNVDRAGIDASIRKLGVTFDAVYTAEDIGSYKPADDNFIYLLEHLESDLGKSRNELLHVAQSLHHDHAPANRFELANAWIDRQRLSETGTFGATANIDAMPTIDFSFMTLEELADAALVTETEVRTRRI